MKKVITVLLVITLLSMGWAIYSDIIARKAMSERNSLQEELTSTKAKIEPKKTGYAAWNEDKNKRDDAQKKQNLIFELENLQKELDSKHISTTVIDDTIKELSEEKHEEDQ
jgi:hypothetical protein